MSKDTKILINDLQLCGWFIVRSTNHIVMKKEGKGIISIPKSCSDVRGLKNLRKQIDKL
jgi:thioredoxin-related protein